jgi:hypothetical protein
MCLRSNWLILRHPYLKKHQRLIIRRSLDRPAFSLEKLWRSDEKSLLFDELQGAQHLPIESYRLVDRQRRPVLIALPWTRLNVTCVRLNVPWMQLNVPWMRLNVPWMFAECSLNATGRSLNVPWMFPECSEKDIWARVLSNRLLYIGRGTPRRPPTSLVVKPTLLPPWQLTSAGFASPLGSSMRSMYTFLATFCHISLVPVNCSDR